MAKAVARFNMHRGSPFVKQGELTKSVLELDDPGLVVRLYEEPQQTQANEAEDQKVELLLMTNRFAATVNQADDDKTHLQVIGQWFEVRMTEQPPLDSIVAGLVFKHIQEHGAALKAKKDPMNGQLDRMFKPISGALLQIAQSQPANVVPMSGVVPSQGGQQPPIAGTAGSGNQVPPGLGPQAEMGGV